MRELLKAVRRRGVWVREEQWVDELTVRQLEREEDGGFAVKTTQARLDLVVRDGARLWWVDFSCFHPFIGTGNRTGWRTGGRGGHSSSWRSSGWGRQTKRPRG